MDFFSFLCGATCTVFCTSGILLNDILTSLDGRVTALEDAACDAALSVAAGTEKEKKKA